MERIHWRKTAKVCPQCHKLKSDGNFILELPTCSDCSFDNAIWKEYKRCVYCRNHVKAEHVKKTICKDCLQIFRERHQKFKGSPKLKKGEHYVCLRCGLSKSCLSYARGTSPERCICKLCVSMERIAKESKFRCFHCGSVFSIEEKGWSKGNGQWNCLRCTDKDRKRNMLWAREWRKIPEVQEYYKAYSRYRWHFVEKPMRNKILFFQWSYGLSKKRQINLKGYWHVLNRQLFKNEAKNFSVGSATYRVLDEVDAIMRKIVERREAEARCSHIPVNPLRKEFDF